MNLSVSRERKFQAALLTSLLVCTGAFAQDLDEIVPALRDQAVVLTITTRIAENSQEVWNAYNTKVTIPGRPVNIKLVGENLVVVFQLTPYLNAKGRNALLAQGQIWVDIPNQGMQYKSTMQTVYLDFGEPIYFFPLGSNPGVGTPRIELQIELQRYSDLAAAKEKEKSQEALPGQAESSTPK